MKGYWHVFALSVLLSILTVTFNNQVFIFILFLWLFYLYKRKKLGLVPILLSLFFYIGFYNYIPSNDPEKNPVEKAISGEIQGSISSPVTKSSKKLEFVVQEKTSSNKIIVVTFKEENAKWEESLLKPLKYGATCHMSGLLEFPDRSSNPGQFDYRSYLQTKGVTQQLTLSSLENISCSGASFLNSFYQARSSILQFVILKTNPYTAKWLTALVLGDDSLLDEHTIELFQKWSLSHLLAISGLHVGLIIAIIYFLLIKLNILTREKAQWVMLIILPFYAVIAGGEPSVWRACLMVLLFIILQKIKVVYSLTDVLSILFLLLVLFDKYIIYHIGFQLSFLVTFGLLLSGKWIAATKSPLIISLQISFVAQMMIIPLQLAYFYTFQPLSILLNLLVVPYFSFFVIPFMFFILLLSPLPAPILSVCNVIFETVQRLFIDVLQIIDQIAYFPYILGAMPFYAVVIYYILFLFFMDAIQREKAWRAMKFGGLTVVLITFVALEPYLSPYGTITMLDIGQGDSFVVELPYRKAVFFIDAGAKMSWEVQEPTDSNFKQVIKPYLYSNGIAKIDAIFLTHEDIDHVGSVPFMVDGLHVDRIFLSKFYQLPADTRHKWEKKGISVQRLAAGSEMDFHDYTIRILSPIADKKDSNANSLVMHMQLGGLAWLFTGDIDERIEKEIVKGYPELKLDVLKVAHHGSNTSSSDLFVQHYQPKVAWISVGENNTYGHPTKEVLDKLKKEGVIIFRTDQDGAVQYRFKKEKGTFSKHLPQVNGQ